MNMLSYVAAVKRGLRDHYEFKPQVDGPDPVFAPKTIPDGVYPLEIDGQTDHVEIIGGRISCCNFVGKKKP